MWQCDDSAVTTVPLKAIRACIKGNQLLSDLNIKAPVDLTQLSYIKPSGEIARCQWCDAQWSPVWLGKSILCLWCGFARRRLRYCRVDIARYAKYSIWS